MSEKITGPWWRDRLDRLRRGEKKPNQPHAPSPEPPPPLPDIDPEAPTEIMPDRGSIIIDDTIDDSEQPTEKIN